MSWLRLALLGLIPIMTLAAVGSALAEGPETGDPSPERQAALRHMLVQDCGSCHGLTLRGGLGPPLLPANLSGKPAAFLQATIIHGRPGTAMPPWRPFLTDADSAWMVNTLQQGVTP